MSPIQRIFRNDSVQRRENHLAGWLASTQRRLPDAALADLAALIARYRAAPGAEADAVPAHRLVLDSLPAAARLRAAARRIERGHAAAGRGKPGEPAGSLHEQARHLVAAARDFQDVSETRPLLLERLIESRIDGREYIQSLRENRASPVVLLK